MQILPAIDITAGRVARSGTAAADPITTARGYAAAGARWLHVVDVDRAVGRGRAGDGVVRRIARGSARVQLGGGLVDPADVAEALGWGVGRVVLGAAVLMDPDALAALVSRFGADLLGVSLDARAGLVVGRALDPSAPPLDLTLPAALDRARGAGVTTVVYRDLARDGTLAGADWDRVASVLAGGLAVIVAGGIASLDEVRRAAGLGAAGVIIGRALHDGRFTLADALACSP